MRSLHLLAEKNTCAAGVCGGMQGWKSRADPGRPRAEAADQQPQHGALDIREYHTASVVAIFRIFIDSCGTRNVVSCMLD